MAANTNTLQEALRIPCTPYTQGRFADRESELKFANFSDTKKPYHFDLAENILRQNDDYIVNFSHATYISEKLPRFVQTKCELNDLLDKSKDPQKLRGAYDKLASAARENAKLRQFRRHDEDFVDIKAIINESSLEPNELGLLKEMFKVSKSANDRQSGNSPTAQGLCSEDQAFREIISSFL